MNKEKYTLPKSRPEIKYIEGICINVSKYNTLCTVCVKNIVDLAQYHPSTYHVYGICKPCWHMYCALKIPRK